jgi:NADPH:quinone reductase-like Zn-dependent oxidoreductase
LFIQSLLTWNKKITYDISRDRLSMCVPTKKHRDHDRLLLRIIIHASFRSLASPCEDVNEFPLILGRDFSGEVVDFGRNVSTLKVGQPVWGVSLPSSQGSHADYVKVPSHLVTSKPDQLSLEESAAIPYAAATAFSALTITAEIDPSDLASNAQLRVLVLGGSGGVGHLAIQMLNAWGCQVQV